MSKSPRAAADDEYNMAETARRRDAALKKMLATPPTPHTAKPKKAPSRRKATTKRNAKIA